MSENIKSESMSTDHILPFPFMQEILEVIASECVRKRRSTKSGHEFLKRSLAESYIPLLDGGEIQSGLRWGHGIQAAAHYYNYSNVPAVY